MYFANNKKNKTVGFFLSFNHCLGREFKGRRCKHEVKEVRKVGRWKGRWEEGRKLGTNKVKNIENNLYINLRKKQQKEEYKCGKRRRKPGRSKGLRRENEVGDEWRGKKGGEARGGACAEEGSARTESGGSVRPASKPGAGGRGWGWGVDFHIYCGKLRACVRGLVCARAQ